MNKTFVIGDIHGCHDELIELLELTGADDNDIIISVGDIIDRGSKSKETWRFFKDRPNTVVLMGNHERKHLNGILSYAQDIVKVQMEEEYEAFLSWVAKLPYYFETDEAIIVHAAFEHDKNLYEQREDVLAGTTSGERHLEKKYVPDTWWSDYYIGTKPLIYGHHVVGDTPKIKNNTYGIDTGACHGKFLTAIELPGFIIHQVQAKKDYWAEEQKKWQVPVLEARPWSTMDLASIQKQLDKLNCLEDIEVKNFLDSKRKWLTSLIKRITELRDSIDKLTADLLAGDKDFGLAANAYPFSRYLFISRANKLSIEELGKVLTTPEKINSFSKELGMPAIILE